MLGVMVRIKTKNTNRKFGWKTKNTNRKFGWKTLHQFRVRG